MRTWTPAFSTYGGLNWNWTAQPVQKNAIPLAGAALVPLFTGQAANNVSSNIGPELFAGLTWRFAPGLALDSAGGYMRKTLWLLTIGLLVSLPASAQAPEVMGMVDTAAQGKRMLGCEL